MMVSETVDIPDYPLLVKFGELELLVDVRLEVDIDYCENWEVDYGDWDYEVADAWLQKDRIWVDPETLGDRDKLREHIERCRGC